jgi:predicted alpha/beta-hydrolase family hydrolase
MVTLILPGFSVKNKEWSEEVSKSLNLEGEIRPIYWDHWTDPNKKFNAKSKARILSDISKNKVVNIIAKSIGTLVASYIIEKIPMQIGKVVLCGIPLNDLDDTDREDMTRILKNFPEGKIVCIQNSNDPLGKLEDVKLFMSSVNPKIEVIEKERNDHVYPYSSDFRRFLQN